MIPTKGVSMMNKTFENPTVEVVELAVEDVVTVSGINPGDNETGLH